ncbi:MAG TPA: hypothetical protein VGK15_04195 [Candidatus Limnocylindria bacterium]|jgi:hypothetical protein
MLRPLGTALASLLVVASALVAAAPANALTIYTVNGHVTDAVTGAPVPGVCIIIGPPASCPPTAPITDASGNWTTQLINGSDWEVWYFKTGYMLVKDTIPASNTTDPYVLNKALTPTGAPPPGSCTAASTQTPTQTVYLPNITKTLGGPTGFLTPFIVQNTSASATTTLEVSFYRFSDGSCVTRRTVTGIAPGTSFADVPNNDSDLPGDSQFSVVVRSFGSTIVSVVNEHAGSGTRAEALSYNGFSSGATSVSLPNIVRRFFGFHTPFIIQNLGTVSTTATATFIPFSGGGSVTVQRTIAPGQSQFVEPNVEAVLTDNTQYGVTVTASQPIAVVVNTHNDDANVASPVAYSTDGVATGAPTVYGPYAAKNANDQGFSNTVSTIVVQNLSGAPAQPSLTFTPLGGGASKSFNAPAMLANGASWAFDPRYESGSSANGVLCGPSATTFCLADGEYSFVAAAPGNIAAAVNVVSPTTAMGYTALTRAASSFFLPNVTRTLGGATGWSTPILLQTASASGAAIQWRRFSDGQLVTTQNLTITAGSGIRIDPRTVTGLSDDTQYAVTVTGVGGTVAAIVTELNFQGGDGAMTYEGFAAP